MTIAPAKIAPLVVHNRTENRYCNFIEIEDSHPVLDCKYRFPTDTQLENTNILSISDGKLGELTSDKYISSIRLTKLRLSKCDITDIQDLLFLTTPNIDTLDLSGNNLKVITEFTFQSLPRLKSLMVRDNAISFIAGNAFTSNQVLAYLDISSNLLNEIPKNLPTSILQLYLTNNSISRIDDTGSLPQLTELDLCFNDIQSVEVALTYPSLEIFCISSRSLEYPRKLIENSNLGNISDLTIQGFGFNTSLPSSCYVVIELLCERLRKLTIKDYNLQDLSVPPELVDLSLIRVSINPGTILLKSYGRLSFIDFTGSRSIESELTQILERADVKTLTLRDCDIKDLTWLKNSKKKNFLTCDIGENELVCDYENSEIICNSSTLYKTELLGLETLKCQGTDKVFDCSKIIAKAQEEKQSSEWFVVSAVVLCILVAISVFCLIKFYIHRQTSVKIKSKS